MCFWFGLGVSFHISEQKDQACLYLHYTVCVVKYVCEQNLQKCQRERWKSADVVLQ